MQNKIIKMDAAMIKEALRRFIYETTCLSACEEDGSHRCRITKETLALGRKAYHSTKDFI